MNMSKEFNDGYEQMIETVKARALWRIEERIADREPFRGPCPKCSADSLHHRYDVTTHRLLFGKSIRTMGVPVPRARCRRCSKQYHLRDLDQMVVPTTIVLHDNIVKTARDLIGAHGSTPSNPASVVTALEPSLEQFREEASGPVRQHLLQSIASLGTAESTTPAVQAIGRALFLSTAEIDEALDAAHRSADDPPDPDPDRPHD